MSAIVKLRLVFSKKGRAVYISQLDLMRTLQRSFQRAGYPLKYSEGFNPHPLLSVALPMSVGISSDCEILDFKMDNEPSDLELAAQSVTRALPEGLMIHEIYHPEVKVTAIKWLQIEGILDYDTGVSDDLISNLNDVFQQDSIEVLKKTKKGEQMFDCKPHLSNLMIQPFDDQKVKMTGMISAQNPTVNPNLLIKAIPEEWKPDFSRFHRIEVFDEEMNIFR